MPTLADLEARARKSVESNSSGENTVADTHPSRVLVDLIALLRQQAQPAGSNELGRLREERDHYRGLVAVAIAKERDACAAIADDRSHWPFDGRKSAREIATRIRNRSIGEAAASTDSEGGPPCAAQPRTAADAEDPALADRGNPSASTPCQQCGGDGVYAWCPGCKGTGRASKTSSEQTGSPSRAAEGSTEPRTDSASASADVEAAPERPVSAGGAPSSDLGDAAGPRSGTSSGSGPQGVGATAAATVVGVSDSPERDAASPPPAAADVFLAVTTCGHRYHRERWCMLADGHEGVCDLAPDGCLTNLVSSRMCERGVKSCTIQHDAPDVDDVEKFVLSISEQLSARFRFNSTSSARNYLRDALRPLLTAARVDAARKALRQAAFAAKSIGLTQAEAESVMRLAEHALFAEVKP